MNEYPPLHPILLQKKPNEEDVYCVAESVIEHISFEVNAEHEWSKGK